jgi:hypothetical protein
MTRQTEFHSNVLQLFKYAYKKNVSLFAALNRFLSHTLYPGLGTPTAYGDTHAL